MKAGSSGGIPEQEGPKNTLRMLIGSSVNPTHLHTSLTSSLSSRITENQSREEPKAEPKSFLSTPLGFTTIRIRIQFPLS
jgi:hypothetical protein